MEGRIFDAKSGAKVHSTLHTSTSWVNMGKSSESKKKDKGKTSSSSKSSKAFQVPSDHKQTLQTVLDYISTLGLQDVAEKLAKVTSLTAVRIFLSLYVDDSEVQSPGIE